MNYRSLAVLATVSILVTLLIVGVTPSEFRAAEIKHYSMATDGKMYPIWSAMAEMINKNLKEVKLTLKVTASSEENLRLIQRGEVDFFVSDGQLCCKAVSGEEPFSIKFDKIKIIGWMHGNPLQIAVPADSDIRSLMDLRGKRVVVGPMDSPTAASVRTIFGMEGLTYKHFKPSYLGINEGVAAMKEGRVDALTVQASYPTPALVDLSESLPIKLIPIRIELAHRIYRKCPNYIITLFPRNIYIGQTKTVLVIDSPYVWGAASSVPAELVYQILKLTKDNIVELAKVDIRFKQWKFRPSCRKVGFLHSGSVRFYEELEPGCNFRIIFF